MNIKRFIVSPFQTNCYIISNEKEAIIIDPGDNGKKIYHYLQDNELICLAILLTHGHVDHIGGVDYLVDKLNCPVYLNQYDFDYIKSPQLSLSHYFGSEAYRFQPISTVESFSIGNFIIDCHECPGHTPGSVYYIINDTYLFSGDFVFQGSIGRTDFPGSSPYDMKQSLEKFKNLQKNYQIFPGHGDATYYNDEINNNPYL